jgi:hypothetical protein
MKLFNRGADFLLEVAEKDCPDLSTKLLCGKRYKKVSSQTVDDNKSLLFTLVDYLFYGVCNV